jgi:DNA gyrase/topoisomerase IV subunit B
MAARAKTDTTAPEAAAPVAAGEAYDSAQIESQTDREHVRKHLGMYAGSEDTQGLVHAVLEVVSNGVDEVISGPATDIWVTIDKDATVIVRDNGRGIPIGMSQDQTTGEIMPTPQLVATRTKASGKFESGAKGSGYSTSGGTHGMGLKISAYCSTFFAIDIWRDGQHYHQEMRDGSLRISPPVIKPYKGDMRGTQITTRYDMSVFTAGAHVDAERILSKIREVTYPVPRMTIHFADERSGVVETLHAPNGIDDLAVRLAGDDDLVAGFRGPVRFTRTVTLPAGHERNWLRNNEPATIVIDLSLLPTQSDTPGERSAGYTNAIPNPDGGEHVNGVKAGLTRAIKAWMTSEKITKSADTLESQDILNGLCIVVAASVPAPSFAGQHKAKLDNGDVAPLFAEFVRDWFSDWAATNAKTAKSWALHIEAARETRVEFKKQKTAMREQRKGKISSLTSKLADHSGCPPDRAELFLVEGDSAGGTAKAGRDARFQAIFPLRGKPMNVLGEKASKIMANNELAALNQAIGLELRGEYDRGAIRYGKVVFLSDGDVDGGHIQLLLATFMVQEHPDLIRDGRLWMIIPPLYLMTHRKTKEAAYLADDAALRVFLRGKRSDDYKMKRFKGLGEMEAKQLRYVAFDPVTRGPFMRQITLGDFTDAKEALGRFMGEGKAAIDFKKQWLRRFAEERAADAAGE